MDRLLSTLREPLARPKTTVPDALSAFLKQCPAPGSPNRFLFRRLIIIPKFYPLHFFRPRSEEEKVEYESILLKHQGGGVSPLSTLRLLFLTNRGHGEDLKIKKKK